MTNGSLFCMGYPGSACLCILVTIHKGYQASHCNQPLTDLPIQGHLRQRTVALAYMAVLAEATVHCKCSYSSYAFITSPISLDYGK